MVFYHYEFRSRHTGEAKIIPAASLNMARQQISGPKDWQLISCRDRMGGLCWTATDVNLDF